MSFELYPLLLAPHFSPRPWGGDAFRRVLGKGVPESGGPFGEAWELSDHPEGRSRIANGLYAGKLFGDLLREFPQELLGVARAAQRYPLLVKFIDAADDLSVQVHPSDETAPTGDRGKTECWYIMHAEPGAAIVWGLRPGVDAPLLRAAAEVGGNAIGQCIQRVPIATGDFVYIPAGTVHAILRGTLLCEVQQSSNTTYRLYDWDRQPARELHIEASCAVTNFDPAAQRPLITKTGILPPQAWHELVSNEYFTVRLRTLAPGVHEELRLENLHGLIVNVLAGSGRLLAEGAAHPLAAGQTWFLPVGIAALTLENGPEPLRLLWSEARETT